MDATMDAQVREVLIERAGLVEGLSAIDLGDAAGRGFPVLLLRQGERLRAWVNACPHAGRRLDFLPGRFLWSEGRLVCAAHGAEIDLDDGRCVAGPGRGAALAALALRPVADGWMLELDERR